MEKAKVINIWNWQVVDDQTVLIQDQGRRWYMAALSDPAPASH
jgi:hypothetical protein